MANDKIFKRLLALQQNAYCSYSHYPVACILVDTNNEWHEGVNMENASYGLTTCAERNAFASAIAKGVRSFQALHLICGNDKKAFGIPCGTCRQVMAEFCEPSMPVVVWNAEGDSQSYTLNELLPNSFNDKFFRKE